MLSRKRFLGDRLFMKQLIDSQSNSYPEIRFMKEQQFRTTHYTLILFAAVIALFQVKVTLPCPIYFAVKLASMMLVVVLAVVAVKYQLNNHKSLQEYRSGQPELESKSQEDKDLELEEKRHQSMWYLVPFVAITVLGAFAAAVVLFFDT